MASSFGDRSAKAQFKAADRAGARYAVIIGEDELAAGTATVRSLADTVQEQVPLAAVVAHLAAHR